MEGHAVISHEVLASYAADAARQVGGVHELVGGPRRHRGVRVADEDGATSVELQLAVEWGAVAPDVAAEVQRRVSEYLRRTARLPSVTVDVVVVGVAATED
ncbi:MAG: Asp23/Gls24 family envelope stress response protein [Gaiella sp.]|nr:Asp23/Gls24 family envelope stress response protein [Gaiella sp.]